MAAERYSIERFVRWVTGRGYLEVIDEADRECGQADEDARRGAYAKNKAQTASRREYAAQYAADLRGLLFYLCQGVKPHGVSDETFQSFRPIFESLVSQGQMKPSVLAPFDV
jgi:hypothetical protein